MDLPLGIIGLSLLLLVLSAVVAVRMIALHQKRMVGILMLAVSFLMFFHEAISLYRHISAGEIKIDSPAEMVACVFSFLLLLGFLYITKLLTSLQEEINRQTTTEENLIHINAKLRALIEAIPDAVFFKDTDLNYVTVNKAFERNTGMNKEMVIGKTAEDFSPPDVAESCRKSDEVLMKNGGLLRLEDTFLRSDGKIIIFDSVKAPIYDSHAEPIGIVGVSRDISERRRMEKEILRLSRQNELILNSAGEGIFGVDRGGNITFINPAAAQMVGWTVGELIGKPSHAVFHHSRPDGAPYPRGDCPFDKALVAGEVHQVKDEVFWRKDGTSFPVEYVTAPMRENGAVVGAVGVFKDIADRKQAEEALRASVVRAREEKTKSDAVISALGDSLVIIDPEFRIIYQNAVDKQMTGYHFGEVCYKAYEKRNAPCEGCPVARAFADGGIHRAEGTGISVRHMEKTASPLRDESGKIIAVIEMVRDVTRKKKTEEALRRSEARLRAIFENTALGIAIATLDRKIILANPALGRFLGYDTQELLGMDAGSFSDPSDDRVNIQLYTQMIEGSQNHYQMEKRYVCKDGRVVWGLLIASIIRDAEGKPEFLVAMIEDITARKQTEAVLQQARKDLEELVEERTAELTMMNEQLRSFSSYLQEARERERTLIAREIHDELGQALTALTMDLAWIRKKIRPDQKELIEKQASMSDLVKTTMGTVKRIATELRPGILDHLGLTAAMEWQAGEFSKRTGIHCNLVFEPDDLSVDRDRTTTLFRIFQETLTNITRHARATEVRVVLGMNSGELVLSVSDNGRGITEQQAADPKSLGLIGMRERVYAWGGNVTITGAKNAGTTIAVRVPLAGRGETS